MAGLSVLLRRRWATVFFFAFAGLGCGALWAASVTPGYRSTAVVDGVSTTADLGVDSLAHGSFRAAVADRYDQPLADTLVADSRLSDRVAELTVEARVPAVATELADLFAETVVDLEPGSRVVIAASFPTSPTSPNLKRIAAITGVLGLLLGFGVTFATETLRPDDADLAAVRLSEPISPSWLDDAPAPSQPIELESIQKPQRVKVPRVHQPQAPPKRSGADAITPRVVELPPRPTARQEANGA